MKTSFLDLNVSNRVKTTWFSLLTILVAEYGVKDVPNIATGEQEDVAGFLFGRLMAEKRDSRRVPDGVEETRTDAMSWTQHCRCHVLVCRQINLPPCQLRNPHSRSVGALLLKILGYFDADYPFSAHHSINSRFFNHTILVAFINFIAFAVWKSFQYL